MDLGFAGGFQVTSVSRQLVCIRFVCMTFVDATYQLLVVSRPIFPYSLLTTNKFGSFIQDFSLKGFVFKEFSISST